MLKLLVYVPCEKVIISDDDTASIISVLETVTMNAPADIPADAFAPIRWSIMSLWHRTEEVDGTVELEERTDVIRPDGSMASTATISTTVTNQHLMYRSLVNFPLFPIGRPGTVWVKCYTRQLNPETEWAVQAEFPLTVVHQPMKPTEEPAQEAEGKPAAPPPPPQED